MYDELMLYLRKKLTKSQSRSRAEYCAIGAMKDVFGLFPFPREKAVAESKQIKECFLLMPHALCTDVFIYE